jgi:hypothetical protein
MFDKILFKNAVGYQPLIDIGTLAESLIFYGKVNIVVNSGTLKYLLSEIPPFILLELLQSGRIELHYLSDQIGVSRNERPGNLPLHSLVTFSSPQHTPHKTPYEIFNKRTGNKLAARKFGKHIEELNHGLFNQEAILDFLVGSNSIESMVSSIINDTASEFILPGDFRFKIEQESKGFVVDTNLNFEELNNYYHKHVPKSHSSLTPAYIISILQGGHEELYFSGSLDSEVAVSGLTRNANIETINSILEQRMHSEEQIQAFTTLTLNSGHAIREAVNSKKVPFSEILKLVNKADKFRDWLHNQPPEDELIHNYYQEVTKETWVEELPGKSTRWGVFTAIGLGIDAMGAGGLGTLAGTAIGAFDTFVLDKIINGWKPHHFVEDELKRVINESKKDA